MFRQMAKLNQAQRAYREGRLEEALGLADDPEIRDHLKAEQLRRRCLDAMQDRAAERAEQGDLSGAMKELDGIAKHAGRDEAARRADDIRARKEELAVDRDGPVPASSARGWRLNAETSTAPPNQRHSLVGSKYSHCRQKQKPIRLLQQGMRMRHGLGTLVWNVQTSRQVVGLGSQRNMSGIGIGMAGL